MVAQGCCGAIVGVLALGLAGGGVAMGLVKKSKYRVLAESRGFDVGQVGSYADMIDAAEVAFDDFLDGGSNVEQNRSILGLS